MTRARLLIASCVAVLALAALGAAAANASVIEVGGLEARGRIAETSVGKLTFSSELANVECRAVFTGAARSRTEGALNVVEPATNPKIAQITEARFTECSALSSVAPLLPFEKYILEHNEMHPEIWLGYIVMHYLIRAGFEECLTEARVRFEYNTSNGRLTFTGVNVTVFTPLFVGGCPLATSIRGVMAVEPILRLSLR